MESILPLTEEALAVENSRLELYFKHVKTLEAQFSSLMESYEIDPYE